MYFPLKKCSVFISLECIYSLHAKKNGKFKEEGVRGEANMKYRPFFAESAKILGIVGSGIMLKEF